MAAVPTSSWPPWGASSYTFACATPRETMKDWLESTARALAFIGGVPQLIVPDNPKAMIADANRYEPRSNETVLDFARHYGTSILPARPRHPLGKIRGHQGKLGDTHLSRKPESARNADIRTQSQNGPRCCRQVVHSWRWQCASP